MDMDPELTEAEVEALEKVNVQVQNLIESMRIQAAYKAEQFDMMMNMMEGMIQDIRALKQHPDDAVECLTPSSEPSRGRSITATPDSVTKNITSFVEDCQNDAEEKSSSEHHEIVSSSTEPKLISEDEMKNASIVDGDVVEEEINFSHLINDSNDDKESEIVAGTDTEVISRNVSVEYSSGSVLDHVEISEENFETKFCDFKYILSSCLLPVCVYDSVKVSCAFVRNMSFVRIQFSTQSHYTSALRVKPPPKPPDGSFEVRRMLNLTKIIESAIGYHMIRCRGDLRLPLKLPSMEFKVLPLARVKFKRVYGTFGIWNEVLLFCYSRMGRTGFGESTELSDAIEDSKELMCSFVSHENHLLLDSRVDYSALSCVSFVAASLSLSGPIYMAIESEELISPEDTCIQIHSIRTDSDSYILVPERKADDLSVLLRNMNDFNEVESSLVCRLQLWTWIKGVQWCPYVKFVDGNFVYDKGKGHKYNKKYVSAFSVKRKMDLAGIVPSSRTFDVMVECYVHENRPHLGLGVAGLITKHGFVVKMYVVNLIIKTLLQNGEISKATELFRLACRDGLAVNVVKSCLPSVYQIGKVILHTCYASGSTKDAQWVTKPPPMPPDVFFINTLLTECKMIMNIHGVAFKVVVYPVEVRALNSNGKGLFQEFVDNT